MSKENPIIIPKKDQISDKEMEQREREAEELLGKSEKVEVDLGFELGDKVALKGDDREWTVISKDEDWIKIGIMDENGNFEKTKNVEKKDLELKL